DVLLAALVPLGLALWLTSDQSQRELEKSAGKNLMLLAQVTASRLDQLLQDTARTVQLLSRHDVAVGFCAGNTDTRQALRKATKRLLHGVVDTKSDFASIFLTDTRGECLAGPGPVSDDDFRSRA